MRASCPGPYPPHPAAAPRRRAQSSSRRRALWTTSAGAIAVATALGACGPVYVQGRDDGYYQGQPQPVYPAYPAQPAPAPAPARSQVADDPRVVFGDLGAHGSWQWLAPYGWVFVPYANRSASWRPYYFGQWLYTDYGWAWESEEPWGNATYHYGRWFWRTGMGWLWVPGYEWAPAWVAWRHGGGCVGWAPLAPSGINIEVHAYWIFVQQQHINRTRVHTVVLQPQQSQTVWHQTTDVQNTNRVRGQNGAVVYNAGPTVEICKRWTGQEPTRTEVQHNPGIRPRSLGDVPVRPSVPAEPTDRNTPGNAPRDQPTGPGPVGQPGQPTYNQPRPPGEERPQVPVPPPGNGTPRDPTPPGVPPRGTDPGDERPAEPVRPAPTYPAPAPAPPVRPAPTYPAPPTRPTAPEPTRPDARTAPAQPAPGQGAPDGGRNQPYQVAPRRAPPAAPAPTEEEQGRRPQDRKPPDRVNTREVPSPLPTPRGR